MNVGVSVHGEREIVLKLERAAVALTGANLERVLVAGALLPVARAKHLCRKKTGNLARSIHIGGHSGASGGLTGTSGTDIGGNVSAGTSATIQAGTNVSYAHALEDGTGPHDITPTNAKALFWKGAAHPVKVVHHPGSSPYPFLRPAFDESIPAMAVEMGAAAMAIIRAAT